MDKDQQPAVWRSRLKEAGLVPRRLHPAGLEIRHHDHPFASTKREDRLNHEGATSDLMVSSTLPTWQPPRLGHSCVSSSKPRAQLRRRGALGASYPTAEPLVPLR